MIDNPLTFKSGHQMANRFALAPMTNTMSHEDGTLSEDELRWLEMRAQGGFGMVMTCASHVQEIGQGFPGQLGIWGDHQIAGHQRLTSTLRRHGALSLIQLHHAGMRAPADLIGTAPVCPSDHEKYSARAMLLDEIEQVREDFIKAAIRAQQAGYDGVEIHGAHGYLLAQFLSSDINKRKDRYGGDLEGRCRLIQELIDGLRDTCGEHFIIGLRLSPERFGMQLDEIRQLTATLVSQGRLDFIDLSLWDIRKPAEDDPEGRGLLEVVTSWEYSDTRLTVAGKINGAEDVRHTMHHGADFVSIGRAAILHHDYPQRVVTALDFEPAKLPVSADYLRGEGLGEDFITYMKRWPGFVAS